MRAFLLFTLNEPKSRNMTRSSRDKASVTSDRNSFSTAETLRLDSWVLDAASLANASLFMVLRKISRIQPYVKQE